MLLFVVVVFDDDTYYWVYGQSSDHPFQVYYKVGRVYYKVRQSVITKCDSFFITKCDRCYKVQRLLQSVTEHGSRISRLKSKALGFFRHLGTILDHVWDSLNSNQRNPLSQSRHLKTRPKNEKRSSGKMLTVTDNHYWVSQKFVPLISCAN